MTVSLIGAGIMLLSLVAVAQATAREELPDGLTLRDGLRLEMINDTGTVLERTTGAGVRPALSLHFEPNRGQADPKVKFVGRGAGSVALISETEVTVRFTPLGTRPPSPRGHDAPPASHTMTMTFVGANVSATAVGSEELPGKSNYLLGRDPSGWRTSIPRYARVTLPEVYRGIDLVYRNQEGRLAYDLVVRPHADPGAILLAFDGAESVRIDEADHLVVRVRGREVRHEKPVIYQDLSGSRRIVPGGYVLKGDRVGFQVGPYNPALALIIDPTIVSVWGTVRPPNFTHSVAVDRSGNTYLLNGEYVTKFNANRDIVYDRVLPARGSAIAVDPAGDVYVSGGTERPDLPTTAGAFQRLYRGSDVFGGDAFVVKLGVSGDIVYATYLGGRGYDHASSISVDAFGFVYLAGSTTSGDFPITPGAVQTSKFASGFSAFVTKLNQDGSNLVYSTFIAGYYGQTYAGSATIDPDGHVYVAGSAYPEGFVLKLNPAGSGYVFIRGLGGSDVDFANAVAIDGSRNVYVTGYTNSRDFPLANSIQQLGRERPPGRSVFVTKLVSSGASLAYSTLLGGSVPGDQGLHIAVDSGGRAHVICATANTDFPTTREALRTSFGGVAGRDDTALAILDASGTVLLYSTYLGGYAGSIALDSADNIYLSLDPENFPAAAGTALNTLVVKFAPQERSVPLQFVSFPAAFPSLPLQAAVGVPYAGNIGIGGGRPPYTITVLDGALPPGLHFGSPTVSGTPSQPGTSQFLVDVLDDLGERVRQRFEIVVAVGSLLQPRTVRLLTNVTTLRPGDTFTVGLDAQTSPSDPATDLYVGVLLPDGYTAMFFSSPGVLAGPLSLLAPATLPRMATAVPPSYRYAGASLLQTVVPAAGLPPGIYTLVAALVRSGALLDNQIGFDDVLALDLKEVTILP